MDTCPIPARSLGRYYKINGKTLERNYKEHLSSFSTWEQREHASEWTLLPKNMGERLSIDESMHQNDLFTFLSNKDGHGKKGTLIASVRGTKSQDVIKILNQIPEELRLAVKEVTMDYSDSMFSIVESCFPNAIITIDVFHVIKNQCDFLNELRMRYKRKAMADIRKEKKAFNRKKKLRKKRALAYRRTHPKKKGEKRGRPRKRLNEKFKPEVMSNGDTKVELFTRSRHFLSKSRDKWSKSQEERSKLLFKEAPKLKEAYDLVNELRSIFKNKLITKEEAREKLHSWYKSVANSKIQEMIAAKNTLASKEDNVLNYFINHATNAAAESLNSKMKGFRSELRGVCDLPFFLFRCHSIFG